MAIRLRNPHSVLAAFETRSQAVVEIRMGSARPAGAGAGAGAWGEVIERAGAARVPVIRETARAEGRRRSRQPADAGGRAGAAEALVKERPPVLLEELWAGIGEGGERDEGGAGDTRGLWLALDQLQDPHNVGAIFRTAAFFGVQGIVLTRDRSAPLSATVYDVAAGGLEYVPFAVEANLSRALQQAKQAGLWVLGASEHAAEDAGQVPRDRPWLLVLGNEERGLRRLTLDRCDALCRLTPRGRIGSLNVSVAAGILMATLLRR